MEKWIQNETHTECLISEVTYYMVQVTSAIKFKGSKQLAVRKKYILNFLQFISRVLQNRNILSYVHNVKNDRHIFGLECIIFHKTIVSNCLNMCTW